MLPIQPPMCPNGNCTLTCEDEDPCPCCTFEIYPTVSNFTDGTQNFTDNGTVTITNLTPCSIIQLKIDNTDCYEEVSGWEAMFYNLEGSQEYTVVLDWNGIGTICWAEDDSYCVTYDICPIEHEYTFPLLDEIDCPP